MRYFYVLILVTLLSVPYIALKANEALRGCRAMSNGDFQCPQEFPASEDNPGAFSLPPRPVYLRPPPSAGNPNPSPIAYTPISNEQKRVIGEQKVSGALSEIRNDCAQFGIRNTDGGPTVLSPSEVYEAQAVLMEFISPEGVAPEDNPYLDLVYPDGVDIIDNENATGVGQMSLSVYETILDEYIAGGLEQAKTRLRELCAQAIDRPQSEIDNQPVPDEDNPILALLDDLATQRAAADERRRQEQAEDEEDYMSGSYTDSQNYAGTGNIGLTVNTYFSPCEVYGYGNFGPAESALAITTANAGVSLNASIGVFGVLDALGMGVGLSAGVNPAAWIGLLSAAGMGWQQLTGSQCNPATALPGTLLVYNSSGTYSDAVCNETNQPSDCGHVELVTATADGRRCYTSSRGCSGAYGGVIGGNDVTCFVQSTQPNSNWNDQDPYCPNYAGPNYSPL